MTAVKKQKNSSDLQFVYEEEKVEKEEKQIKESIEDEFEGIEFSATVVTDIQEVLNEDDTQEDDNEIESEIDDQDKYHKGGISIDLGNEDYAEEIEHSKVNVQRPAPVPENVTNSKEESPQPKKIAPVQQIRSPKSEARSTKQHENLRQIPIDTDIQNQIYEIRTHAEIKVAIAEFKAEFLAEHLGEAKALEFQIKQLLRPLAKSNNPAIVKQISKIQKLVELHANGTKELVRQKAKADKIEKPVQEKINSNKKAA